MMCAQLRKTVGESPNFSLFLEFSCDPLVFQGLSSLFITIFGSASKKMAAVLNSFCKRLSKFPRM